MAYSTPTKNRDLARVLGVLVLAFAVRGGFLAIKSGDLADDPDGYRQLAANLVDHGVYGDEATDESEGQPSVRPTAFRPPLYPLVLALLSGAGGMGQTPAAILHLLLGVATVVLVHALARQWQLGRWALLAAALTACDPVLLNQSTLLMTETLATFLAVVGLICLTRLGERPTIAAAAMAGGALAAASLCRPTFLVWLGAAAVLLTLSTGLRFRRRQVHGPSEQGGSSVGRASRPVQTARESRPTGNPAMASTAIVFVLVAAIVLSPWVCRNYMVFRRPVLATTHGGYTLMLGNNDGFYDFLQQSRFGDVWNSRGLDERYNRIKQQRNYDEVEADRWAYRQAVACIQRRGGMFAWSCAVRIGRLWGLVPHRVDGGESTARRLARYAVGLWYAVVFLFAAVGAFSLRRRLLRSPWVWGLLLCLSFTAVHTLYWSNLRMRAPLVPVLCMAAALGAKRITARRAIVHQ